MHSGFNKWEEVEQIFNQAVLLPAAKRKAFLKQACENAPELYAEVASLLSADQGADEILEQPVFPAVARLLDESSSMIGRNVATYKIERILGQGGMGTVFLAEDTRLGRFVALKILPFAAFDDSEVVQRFRQEAKAACTISHPNVAHIYEFGQWEGTHYLAMEYVPGDTLREAMKKNQPNILTAVLIARQIAGALKAAHEEDVTHRDVKPENILLRQTAIVTDEVIVKVLDFGLAKFGDKQRGSLNAFETAPGLVIGTTAYMSPEQVRGVKLDGRTDLWSLGVIFYEMLSGTRPFDGETPSDIQASILLKEPPFPEVEKQIPLLGRILRKALCKEIANRYQSARDFESDLRSLHREVYDHVKNKGREILTKPSQVKANGSEKPSSSNRNQASQRINQLTFYQGFIQSARFSPDARKVVFSAAWGGDRPKLFNLDVESKDAEEFSGENVDIYGVSNSGELAIALNRRFLRGYISVGVLSTLDRIGAVPRRQFDKVQFADWHPVEHRLYPSNNVSCWAVIREVDGRSRLEYPAGNVLAETGGWISHPRFSPSGDRIAFIEHATSSDDSGSVCVVDLKGRKKVLSEGWVSAQGLAWCPNGKRIWFTAAKEGNARSIHEVSIGGKERLVYQSMGSLRLHDISADGRVLITVDKTRIRMAAHIPALEEFEISWHDWSLVRDLSADGKTVLFTEAGESGGAMYKTYIRQTDGSPAQKIGNGSALALSPDGKSALVRMVTDPQKLAIFPVSGDSPAKVLKRPDTDAFFYQPWACWFPDGKKILFSANSKSTGTKLFVQKLNGKPKCITESYEGVELSSTHAISPDGKLIVVLDAEQRVCFCSADGGKLIPLENLGSDFLPVRWSGDGKSLFLRKRGALPAEIYIYELATGQNKSVLKLTPKDKTGLQEILRIVLTPGAEAFAYSYTSELSDLFAIEGLK